MMPKIFGDNPEKHIKQATETLLHLLQHHHKDHDAPGIDDVDLTQKDKSDERTSVH